MIFIVDLFLQRVQQTCANRWPTVNAWRLFLKLLYIDIMYCFRCATLIVCLFSLLYIFFLRCCISESVFIRTHFWQKQKKCKWLSCQCS